MAQDRDFDEPLPDSSRPRAGEPTPIELAPADDATFRSTDATTPAAPNPSIALIVVDADEAPVADAEIVGREITTNLRTNQDGYAAVTPPRIRPRGSDPNFLTVTVSAYDYCPQTIALSLPAPSLTRVTLVRAAWLDVHLADVAGPAAATLQVQVAELGNDRSDSPRRAYGSLLHPANRRLSVDESGHCLINGLTPGSPIALAILDRYGTTVVGPQKLVLAPGERRRLDLLLGFDPRDLIVTVRDEFGSPLADARVGLVPVGKEHLGTATEVVEKTDGSGRAEFSSLCLARVDVQAVAPGHGLAFMEDIALPSQATFLEMSLGPALQVDVNVVDGTGRPFFPEFVGVLDLPMPLSAEVQPSGRYRLSGLPRGKVLISALQQGRRFDTPHDSAVRSATITVDTPGELIVRCELKPGDMEDGAPYLLVQHGETDASYCLPESASLDGAVATLQFGGLLPGEWRISLVQRYPTEPITEVIPVSITASVTTSVTLKRR
jgi:hypothetical protein